MFDKSSPVKTSTPNITDIFEHALECISRIDKQGNYLSVNERFAETFGYSPEEMQGLAWANTIHQDDVEKAKDAYQLMLDEGRADVELRGIRKNGSTFYKNIVLVRGIDDDKSMLSHYCFMQDITERKLADKNQLSIIIEEAKNKDEKLKRLISMAPGVVFRANESRETMCEIDNKIQGLTGYSNDELIKQYSFNSLIHEDDIEKVSKQIATAVESSSPYSCIYRIKNRDGNIVYVKEQGIPFLDKENQSRYIDGILTELDAVTQTEESVQSVTDAFYQQSSNLYFRNAAQKLCEVAKVKVSVITECMDFSNTAVKTLAFYNDGKFMESMEYEIINTPCESVIKGNPAFYEKDIQSLFPKDTDLVKLDAESYCAVPLKNSFEEVIGHIFILDDQPLGDKEKYISILNSFSTPVAKELEQQQNNIIINELVKIFNIRQGENSFNKLALYIQNLLKVDYIIISELIEDRGRTNKLRSLAYCHQNNIKDNIEYTVTETPCEKALNNSVYSVTHNVIGFHPESELLKELEAEGYIGAPLFDSSGKAVGMLELINTMPIKNIKTYESLVTIFASRAADELNSRQHLQELNIYKDMVNVSRDLISIVNRDYTYEYVNKSYLDFYNKIENEIVNHNLYELHGHESFNELMKPNLDKCFNGENVSYQINKISNDGEMHNLQVLYTPHYSSKGEVLGAVVVSRDLTDYVGTLRELDQSREYIDKVIRLSPDIICVTSFAKGEIIEVNEGFCNATGWAREDILGKTTTELGLYTQEFRDNVVALIANQGEIDGKEFQFFKKNGEPAYVLASSFFIDLYGGNSILTIARDITERKQSELLLELESKCYQIESKNNDFKSTLEEIIREIESNFDSLIGSICLLDADGKCIMNTIAPGLPEEYCDLIKGVEIGPDVGSCGTAAYNDELVIVSDIQNNMLWKNYRDLAKRFELKACWSIPIKSTRQEVMGTFAGYYKRVQEPSSFEVMMLYRVANIVGTIVEQKSNDQKLKESREKFRTLYDDTPSMFFSLKKDGSIISVNQFGARHLGYTIKELMGQNVLTIIYDEDQEKAQERLKQCFVNAGSMYRWEIRKKHRNGRILWVRETAHVVNTNDEQEILIVCEDISENHRLSQQLEYQATHDALTTLVNRREFETRLGRLLDTKSIRIPGHAICYLDLDNFKVINDTCGHLAGDAMLKQLSELLSASVRSRDTLARLGGDEFGILMENCTLKQAYGVAEKILNIVEEFRFMWEENKFTVGVSIGLVPIDETSGNVTDVLSAADNACYVAKDSGRNRIHVFSPNDDELERRRGEMQWVSRINQALEEELFCLFYQDVIETNPFVNSKRKRFELLVRMRTHDGGYILPGAFLPAAERYNLSNKIDQWVIKSALGWLSSDKKILKQIESCAINISGHSLSNEYFLDFCIENIDNSNVPANKLCFEITETAAIANLSSARNFISELKEKGCSFALDDFGSGLSSFGYLKNLPVDYIKIDGAFIRDLLIDPVDHEMVTAINRLGHVMDKKTIAEFVENEETLVMLNEIGVDYSQGYGIAKPKPIELFVSD